MDKHKMVCVGVSAALSLSLLTGCGGGQTESEPLSDLPTVSTVPTDSASDVTTTTTTASEVTTTTAPDKSTTTTTTAPGKSTTTTTTAPRKSTSTTAAPTTTAPQGPIYHNDLEVVGKITDRATLCKFDDNLYKLDVPDTAVFFIKLTDDEWAIVDAATYGSDVSNYIVPAAARLGIDMNKIVGILITHEHNDHNGGLPTLLSHCPNAMAYGVNASNSNAGSRYQSIKDGASLFGGTVKMVTLRGHAVEACGYYDTRSKTVMTGDSIQFYGVGNYGCQLYGGVTHYEASMEKLKGMVTDGTIENILITHQYVPVSAVSKGRQNSLEYMTIAQSCYEVIKSYTIEKYNSGTRSPEAIQSAFIAEQRRYNPDFPTGYFQVMISDIINTYCR